MNGGKWKKKNQRPAKREKTFSLNGLTYLFWCKLLQRVYKLPLLSKYSLTWKWVEKILERYYLTVEQSFILCDFYFSDPQLDTGGRGVKWQGRGHLLITVVTGEGGQGVVWTVLSPEHLLIWHYLNPFRKISVSKRWTNNTATKGLV